MKALPQLGDSVYIIHLNAPTPFVKEHAVLEVNGGLFRVSERIVWCSIKSPFFNTLQEATKALELVVIFRKLENLFRGISEFDEFATNDLIEYQQLFDKVLRKFARGRPHKEANDTFTLNKVKNKVNDLGRSISQDVPSGTEYTVVDFVNYTTWGHLYKVTAVGHPEPFHIIVDFDEVSAILGIGRR